MRGRYPVDYFHQPDEGPPEKSWADFDAYTNEFLPDEPDAAEKADFHVVLPPLRYGKTFLKGLYLSQGVDALHAQVPDLHGWFTSVAYSMWCSYPWSEKADGYLTLYDHPQREAWFRRTNPARADKKLIGLHDADWTSEYVMRPHQTSRDLDVLTVARLHDLKNVPLIAKAVREYERLFGQRIVLTVVVGKPFDVNFDGLDDHERGQVRAIEEAVGPLRSDRVRFVPLANWSEELPKLYARARVCVLGSLIEGKNRSLQEAMLCDTPVVCFADYNRHVRGPTAPFPPEAGVLAETFDATSLAHAIRRVHEGRFTPRRAYLEVSGRARMFETLLSAFPLYLDRLAAVGATPRADDPWIDAAMWRCYGRSTHDFIHGRPWDLTWARGAAGVKALLERMKDRVGEGAFS